MAGLGFDKNKTSGLVGLGPIPSKAPVASFNVDGVLSLLETKGMLAFHIPHALEYRRESIDGALDLEREGRSHQFVYYDVRPIMVVTQSFEINDSLTLMSLSQNGSVALHVNGQYIDKKRAILRPNDLLVLNPEYTTMSAEVFEYKAKNHKLRYWCNDVDYLCCKSKGRLDRYIDFEIVNGQIEFDTTVPDGEVMSIVYEHPMMFVIERAPHSVRLIQSNKTGHGADTRETLYAPQYCIGSLSTLYQDSDAISFYDITVMIQEFEKRRK